jgi:GrpB-like predicted nucleotidyltransferase (UPF0157 family)
VFSPQFQLALLVADAANLRRRLYRQYGMGDNPPETNRRLRELYRRAAAREQRRIAQAIQARAPGLYEVDGLGDLRAVQIHGIEIR